MASPVHIRVEREFRHPRDAAYAWLTDFDEGDAERAGAIVEKRTIVERSADRIVYEGETSVLGNRISGRSEVTLQRPDRWTAHVVSGARKGSVIHYHLVSTPAGSRLTVDYHFVVHPRARHALLRVARPLVRRELIRMWDGFAGAMDRELPREASSSGIPATPRTT